MNSEMMASDFTWFKKDFPLLAGSNRGKPLVYLDSAASAQKPQIVLDTMSRFLRP